MPATFTSIFAEHLGKATGRECHEPKNHDKVEAGQIYVAPGDHHMLVEDRGEGPCFRITDDPPENFCRPAVDPMLRSLSQVYGPRVLTVIMTGMGHDGLNGARVVVDGGGTVIAQDEATSVVWGMPGAVATGGLCSAVLPLDEIGGTVMRVCKGGAL